MTPAFAAGLLLSLAGCTCIYLAADHQRLLPRRWPAAPARIAGALLLVAAQAALLRALQPAAAFFVLCTWAMLLFTLLPWLGALRALRRDTE
ncbi:MAG: hypothetical protein EOP81_17215 [Variovorax sp.]|nr:MAG: hypothetical protein EOP81_17215 [Variovorax sp.]